jgi:ribosomal protein S27E
MAGMERDQYNGVPVGCECPKCGETLIDSLWMTDGEDLILSDASEEVVCGICGETYWL